MTERQKQKQKHGSLLITLSEDDLQEDPVSAEGKRKFTNTGAVKSGIILVKNLDDQDKTEGSH